eukprot:RCo019789
MSRGVIPEGKMEIVEGFASILVPVAGGQSGASDKRHCKSVGFTGDKEEAAEGSFFIQGIGPNPAGVFYNKAQVVNRDLSIVVLRAFAEVWKATTSRPDEFGLRRRNRPSKSQSPSLSILEALGATGLRSLRYRKEVPGVGLIVCNDISPTAFAAIRQNMTHNGVPVVPEEDLSRNPADSEGMVAERADSDLISGIMPHCEDAISLMYKYRPSCGRPQFTVIDLDPYGTAVPFLDSAVQAVAEGGLLLVTCTDAAVLCGAHPESCFARYGAITVKAKYCHEMALRILLGHLEMLCCKYGRYIVPLLSLSIDFYVRVFVRVFGGRNEAKLCASHVGHLYQCVECSAFHVGPVGEVGSSNKAVRRAERLQRGNASATSPRSPAGGDSRSESASTPRQHQQPTGHLSADAVSLEDVCKAIGPRTSPLN